MQRKPKPDKDDEKPISPAYAVLASLFGYPGVGHLLLGKKRQGILFALLFTASSLGLVYEIWLLVPELLQLLRQAVDMQPTLTMPKLDNLPRTGIWIVLSGGFWIGSAVHSGLLAQSLKRQ